MLASTWWGATKARDADAYLEYLHRTGLSEYGKTRVTASTRPAPGVGNERAEFLLVSFWESREALQRFTGTDIEKAVFYPEDERYLVARDNHVTHYEVILDERH